MRNSKRVIDAGSPLPIILPGEVISIQEICRARGWEWACEASLITFLIAVADTSLFITLLNFRVIQITAKDCDAGIQVFSRVSQLPGRVMKQDVLLKDPFVIWARYDL